LNRSNFDPLVTSEIGVTTRSCSCGWPKTIWWFLKHSEMAPSGATIFSSISSSGNGNEWVECSPQ